MLEPEKKRWSHYVGVFSHEVLLPFLLVILGIVIFDPVKDWWLGPKNYKIYLVGTPSPEIDKIFRGVRLGNNVEPLQIDDVPIVLETVDDQKTVDDQTKAADTAKYVAGKDDALLVIGHVYSQRTIEALPIYMGTNPPIPVIATKETSPKLLSPQIEQNCSKKTFGCPLLQLSPTNDEQAFGAIDFALTQAKKRRSLVNQRDHYDFVVLKEANARNSGYVNDLADKYEELLQGEFSRKRIVHQSTINVGDASTFPNIVTGVMSLKPDAIIYVGQSPLARQFFTFFQDQTTAQPAPGAEQPGNPSYQPPLIMLCDAAVSPDIASKGFMNLPSVFAMYPISFSEYNQTDSVLGRDAFAVIGDLVKEAGYHRPLALWANWGYRVRRMLQMHRVRDARESLAAAFRHAFEGARKFTGPTGNDYAFEFPYHRKNGQFHVWAITTKGVIEADARDGDPTFWAQVDRKQNLARVAGPRNEQTVASRPRRNNLPVQQDVKTTSTRQGREALSAYVAH